MRAQLIEKATGSTSKEALEKAPSNQPVVGVRFGRVSQTIYHYPLAALRPCITAETADSFDTDYGVAEKAQKFPYAERQKLIQKHREEASSVLETFGLQFA
jgi:hypothetical protein